MSLLTANKENCFTTTYHIQSCAQAMQKVMKRPLLLLREATKEETD